MRAPSVTVPLLAVALAACASAGSAPTPAEEGSGAVLSPLVARARAVCAERAGRAGYEVIGWERSRAPLEGYVELGMRVRAHGREGRVQCAYDDLREVVQLFDPTIPGADRVLAAAAGAACVTEADRRGYVGTAVSAVRQAGASVAEVQLRGTGSGGPVAMRCTYDDGAGVTRFLADGPPPERGGVTPRPLRPVPPRDTVQAGGEEAESVEAVSARGACAVEATRRGWRPGEVRDVRRVRGGAYEVRLLVSEAGGRSRERTCRYDLETRSATFLAER